MLGYKAIGIFPSREGLGVCENHNVIQNGTKCSEESRIPPLYVPEILPPYGRLDDKSYKNNVYKK